FQSAGEKSAFRTLTAVHRPRTLVHRTTWFVRAAKEQGMTDSNGGDLVVAIQEILRQSSEPLTVPKIRARLRGPFRDLSVDELADVLQRQVAAQVFVVCPKYRSGKDRYWDRSLREHAAVVLRRALEERPMPWSELRKRFPKYLRH